MTTSLKIMGVDSDLFPWRAVLMDENGLITEIFEDATLLKLRNLVLKNSSISKEEWKLSKSQLTIPLKWLEPSK